MRWILPSLAVLAAALPAAESRADALSQAQALSVSHLTLQELTPVRSSAGGAALLSVGLGDRTVIIEAAPHSARSDRFTVVLDRGDGVMEEITPPPSAAVRGIILDEPGSVVTGSIVGDAVNLLVFAADETWTIQPAEGEAPGVHAVFPESAMLDTGAVCGVPDHAAMDPHAHAEAHAHEHGVHHAARGSGEYRIAELAIEADYQLYNNYFGGNQNALLNDVDQIIAGLNTIYERDAALTFELTHVLIRTSNASNPYTTNDPDMLLGQFAAEWTANQQDVQRDVAHLWTGRNMSGSTIGIAALGVICTGSAYGADQIRFTSNYNARVGLFAHEMGHNWAAQHCNGQSECRIMCSGLGGCNGLGNPARFAAGPVSQITGHIASRSCLDNTAVPLPIAESFDSSSLEITVWAPAVGFDFVNDGAAPTGNRAGRLNPPFNGLSTLPVETAGLAPGQAVFVDLYTRPESSGASPFRVNVANADGGPLEVAAFIDSEPGTYTRSIFQLPASLRGEDVRVGMVASGSVAWRFDEFRMYAGSDTSAVIALPFAEDFERAALFADSWAPSAADVTNGVGASSGSFAVELAPGGDLVTADLAAAGAEGIVVGLLARPPADAAPGDELVFEYRDDQGAWTEAGRYGAGSFPAGAFSLAELTLPANAAHGGLRARIRAEGAGGAWAIDDLEIGGERRGSDDCPADIAAPAGVLDLADINAFIAGFTQQEPAADLALPIGVFDLADVNVFITSFSAGCP